MKTYIGTKLIKAEPMTRGEYNQYRGWELPADEDGDDDGYLVEYLDGGKPNHPDHNGYISWSPEGVFRSGYSEVNGLLSFGQALEILKSGGKVARQGWNGKNMFVFLRKGRKITDVDPNSPMGGDFESLPHLCMRAADGSCVVGWLASQTDMLSKDWTYVH